MKNDLIFMDKILRTWTFWIRSDLRDECEAHLEVTKLQEMRDAPGNRRAAALFRARNDGTTIVVVMSIWDSMDSIRAFAGGDAAQPSIDAADLAKIFDSDQKVGHYPLSDCLRALLPPEWQNEEILGAEAPTRSGNPQSARVPARNAPDTKRTLGSTSQR